MTIRCESYAASLLDLTPIKAGEPWDVHDDPSPLDEHGVMMAGGSDAVSFIGTKAELLRLATEFLARVAQLPDDLPDGSARISRPGEEHDQDPTTVAPGFPSADVCERFNRQATFTPQIEDGTRPRLTVAGVQVYAYLHTPTGTVRVSIDLDTPDPALVRDDETVPLTVTCQGNLIFEG